MVAAKEECDQVCKEEEEMEGAAPEPSKKRKYVLKFYDINDSVNCPICLQVCTQSGEHCVWYVIRANEPQIGMLHMQVCPKINFDINVFATVQLQFSFLWPLFWPVMHYTMD